MNDWLLIYDGECPLCIGLSDLYVRVGWIERAQRVALQDLSGEAVEDLFVAGIGNEMAVYEPETRTVQTGMTGIFRMLRESWMRPVALVLDRPVLRQLCDVAYRFIGANRRFLSLPRPRGPACACEPDERPVYNLALIALALCAALLLVQPFETAAAAALVREAQPATFLWRILLVVALALSAVTVPVELRLRLMGHTSMALLHGSLVLILTGLAARVLPDAASGPVLVLGALAACSWVARQLWRRSRYLGLGRALPRVAAGSALASGLLMAGSIALLVQ